VLENKIFPFLLFLFIYQKDNIISLVKLKLDRYMLVPCGVKDFFKKKLIFLNFVLEIVLIY
jgi:hypothetical protein